MLFIFVAVIGILFLVARSNSTNNRIATFENIFRQLWPLTWIRLFDENERQEEGRNQVIMQLK